MKKLLAILLSMLLLCSMIPFATVSAAGDYYIELVADAEEVNAGDEITVEVSLYGHESVGLTGAQIELGFDHDVFELVTYYDEDEEMWMPPIEVGPKFSASSNKYILFLSGQLIIKSKKLLLTVFFYFFKNINMFFSHNCNLLYLFL